MDYIKWIRSKVGNDMIILNFSGAIIENNKGEILLQRRRDRNAWGFPGGAMELGESAVDTAIREIKEETGLVVSIGDLVGIYTKYFDEYPNGDQAQTIAFMYRGKVIGGQLDASNEESIELRFFSPDFVPELFNQQHKDAFEDFINNRTGISR
ncbi:MULTISPECIES: NUDIX hydrolase [Paenibacillus]|uniref:NUDIX domain-containing protein n=1 Tax=Paenibacillus xylanilyticus TaxID=248903 RepID=A0A7Y6BTD8_9BACL|nr:NUDIX domain-containing protein [Paenibacillus xylanilyticus]NUU74451.1 NUDIX domain-containing protein [Paenibacillus xylanilyticus]